MKDGADTLYHGCYNALEGFSKCNINKFIHEKEEYLSQRAVILTFPLLHRNHEVSRK